ncbi:MAG: HAMP domain-containing histidine kinase, partial [Bryobacteraceae bacterium]|nr:HAMP domain-containing histidine kinase [Bryobacteraceae bacterium]
MWQERIQRYLLPGDIESDPGFLAEIRRLSRMGLHVIGGIEIGVTVFMVATNLLLDANTQLVAPRLTMAALMVVVGTLTILSARVPPLYPWCRLSACLSCLASTAVLTWFFIGMTPVERSLKNFVPGNMTLVLLVAVAAVPLRPMQTLLLGSIMEVIYMTIASIQRQFFDAGAGIDPIFVVFTFMLTLLSTALSAVVYHQRSASWEIHNDMLQASDTLRQSETRNLLAQNAASVGRLAAALSHELNSPIGALISGVDTLLLLAARQAVCAGPEQQRMLLLQNELRKTIHQSTDRLKEIVARMQRFTNLDKAEVQAANLNEILSDVIALIEPN